jgi:hypothetical protein
MPREPSDATGQESTLDRIDVVRHDGDSLELVARVNGPTFASALRLVLKVGEKSRLSVQLELTPRAQANDNPMIAVAALSGLISTEHGRDFDRVRATFTDGTSFETTLSEDQLDWGKGEWTSVALGHESVALESLAFLQNGTRAGGNLRPNVTLSNLQSSVPLALELSVSTRPVLGGNVVANLLADSASEGATGAPISVSYLVTAEPP